MSNSALKQAKQLANYNNKLEQKNVKLQYLYNQKLAQENRDWQEDMSNSAHQREMVDLKKAGLNPVLSVTGGAGASTPSGSAASVSKANTDMSLPSKVIDMAITSMNNANHLLATQMQLANALELQRMQNQNSLQLQSNQLAFDQWAHTTPSGNSYFGQFTSALNYMKDKAFEVAQALGYNPEDVSLSGLIQMIKDGNYSGLIGNQYTKDIRTKVGNYLGVTKSSRDNYREKERLYGFDSSKIERSIANTYDKSDKLHGTYKRRFSRLRQWYRNFARDNYRYYQTR